MNEHRTNACVDYRIYAFIDDRIGGRIGGRVNKDPSS